MWTTPFMAGHDLCKRKTTKKVLTQKKKKKPFARHYDEMFSTLCRGDQDIVLKLKQDEHFWRHSYILYSKLDNIYYYVII